MPLRFPLQARLEVGAIDDPLEREADTMAERIMRMPESAAAAGAVRDGVVRRKCAACEREEDEQETGNVVRRKEFAEASDRAGILAPPIVHKVLGSPGQPLDATTRAFMEPRFGRDFGQIRVHADAEANASASAVNAKAYTVGQSIVFARNQYAPATRSGQVLLAHELGHVVQQDAAPLLPATYSASASPAARPQSLALLRLFRQVDDPRHLEVETVNEPRHYRVSQWLVENMEGGGTSRTELYWVDFEVDSTGKMTASVRTVSPDRAYRSGMLRFGDQFRRALDYFRRSGVEVNAFEGDWSYMTETEISDNLRVFKEGMEQGLTREQAAQRTPTGRVVERSGFEIVNVENVSESQEHLTEPRWRVRALFRRVPSAAPAGPSGTPSGGGSLSNSGPASQQSQGAPQAQDPAVAQQPARTEQQVATRFRVQETDSIPGGRNVSQVEVTLGNGLDQVNADVHAHGAQAVPERIVVRITTEPNGNIVGVESLTPGAPEAVAETVARQALQSAPRAAGGVSPWVRGASWAGLVVFATVTAYRLGTAAPADRPRVAAQAAGGLAGGMAAGYLVCNLVLGIETLGWSLLICGGLVGIAGGAAGEAIAGVAYEEATIDDDEIRAWTSTHDLATVGRLPAAEKVRMIFSLMKGWISDDDVAAMTRILQSVTSAAEMDAIRRTVEPYIASQMSSIGQRTALRMALSRRP
jgi:predicted lipid-binding transport protein (Tim44 family)